MNRSARLLPAIAAALCFVSAAQANLVTNGGFEAGDYSGWTLFGNTGIATIDSITPHSGLYTARFGVGASVGLSQDIATTPGTTYDVEFWFSTTGVASNFFVFDWDGGPAEYLVANANPGFATLHFSLPATQAVTTLGFGFTQFESGAWRLDDVSVTAATVPLPGTVALAGLGLGALIRRRRSR
jgi:MYXO-CTERM domain-containing protein